jgi:hypothetical protein
MKGPNIILALLAVCLVAFAGCKKSDQSATQGKESDGVQVDWPKFDKEFAGSDQELQTSAALVKRSIRYTEFPQALAELERLSSNPKLTEAQRKIVSDLLERTKQVIAKAPPPGQ